MLLQLPTLTTVQKHSTCRMHYQCSVTINRSNKLNTLSSHIGCTTLVKQTCAGCKRRKSQRDVSNHLYKSKAITVLRVSSTAVQQAICHMMSRRQLKDLDDARTKCACLTAVSDEVLKDLCYLLFFNLRMQFAHANSTQFMNSLHL